MCMMKHILHQRIKDLFSLVFGHPVTSYIQWKMTSAQRNMTQGLMHKYTKALKGVAGVGGGGMGQRMTKM